MQDVVASSDRRYRDRRTVQSELATGTAKGFSARGRDGSGRRLDGLCGRQRAGCRARSLFAAAVRLSARTAALGTLSEAREASRAGEESARAQIPDGPLDCRQLAGTANRRVGTPPFG